jgi:Baseplate J-like protein
MSLPKPQLDDKTFAQLMEDAIKLIPRYAPEWTDFNKHDPGITFLELFAQLTEQQRYYLDRVQDSSLLKFLKLLGFQPKDFRSARVDVSFSFKANSRLDNTILIPSDTPLIFRPDLSEEDIIFETETDLWMTAITLKKVISFSSLGVKDNTGENDDNKGLSFKAFGDRAEKDSRLYLGFSDLDIDLGSDPFPANKPIGITFDLVEDYPVKRGNHGDELLEVTQSRQSTRLKWEYAAIGDRWKELEIIKDKDETFELTQSGRLYFVAPSDMAKQGLIPIVPQDENSALYWIRSIVEKDGYEIPPQVNTIRLNTIAAIQQQTIAKPIVFSSNGQLSQSFSAPYLVLVGETILQVRVGEETWQDCQSSTINVDRSNNLVTLKFSKSERPDRGHHNIRLICYAPSSKQSCQLARSNGLPNQIFQIKFQQKSQLIVTTSFILQVETQANTWQDWQQVQDFDASQPEDRHYILDRQSGLIRGGNGINGYIFPASSRVRIISYYISQAEKGNVRAEVETIRFMESPLVKLASLEIKNSQAASGGAIAESIEQAQLRARKQLRTPFRAVTSADFEYLALATPGLRVARAKAISPLSEDLSQATLVKVVVVPFSPLEPPNPSDEFLKTVKQHLNKHRLITTKVDVISPTYVEISVVATVRSKPGFPEKKTRGSIEEKLDRFLDPLKGGGVSGEGWEFGRTVYQSEIYAVIESVDAVDCVQSVTLKFKGVAVRDNENIRLSSTECLIYTVADKHDITVETRDRLLGGRRI